MSWLLTRTGDARLARAPFVIKYRAVPTDRQSGRRPRFEPVVAGGHGSLAVRDCPGEHLATLVDGLVQTTWSGVWAMVWDPEGAVAQFGGPAVMIRGGSWCHIVGRRLDGCR